MVSLHRAEVAVTEPMLAYDRESGELTGAGLVDLIAVLALQAGSALTRPFGHRGYGFGCRLVSAAIAERDVVVKLNSDAAFAMPFCDAYWSRLLNRRYDYEEEIEAFLKSAADVDYVLIDCGANFGYWSVLASSKPFGAHKALAIEASPKNAERLEVNAKLNGKRFRCLNAAVGSRPGGYARITGRKHEALTTSALADMEQGAVRVVSLDSLVVNGLIDPSAPTVVKLDVEGVEIEAIKGAAGLMDGDCIVICEEHGSDRDHLVSRYLMTATSMKLWIFDPGTSRFVRIDDLAVLDRAKRHEWVGYNIFATSSALWEERLLSASWSYR